MNLENNKKKEAIASVNHRLDIIIFIIWLFISINMTLTSFNVRITCSPFDITARSTGWVISLLRRKLSLRFQAWLKLKHLRDLPCLVISVNPDKDPMRERILTPWMGEPEAWDLSITRCMTCSVWCLGPKHHTLHVMLLFISRAQAGTHVFWTQSLYSFYWSTKPWLNYRHRHTLGIFWVLLQTSAI